MKKRNILLIHIGYWLVRISPEFSSSAGEPMLTLSYYIVSLATFYLNYLVVMPVLFARKKYAAAAAAWAGVFLFFTFFRYLVEEVLYPALFGFGNYVKGTTMAYYMVDNVAYAFPVIIFSALLWLLPGFIKSSKENDMLKEEKRQAELAFLQSQVNPHFLFNNLNNIYALVYRKSEQALPAVEKLSEIMRFMVKDAVLDRIELNKELKYVRDLIDLQLLRIPGKTYVQFEVTGSPEGRAIAPLLLIPFVENGFKHGDITDAASPFIIKVNISDDALELHTENKIGRGNKDSASGVGLENLARRLALLYPAAHTLQCTQTEATYICNLKLKW